MVASNTHLSCGFGSLPDAEVAHDPGDEQTQGQVPVQGTHVVDAGGNPEHSPPAETPEHTDVSASPPRRSERCVDRLTPRTP